jgi:hypothetical protein
MSCVLFDVRYLAAGNQRHESHLVKTRRGRRRMDTENISGVPPQPGGVSSFAFQKEKSIIN